MVEFAVVLPVLMAFILGIITFGQFENDASALTSISEQAARNASLNLSPGGPSQTLQAYSAAQATGDAQNNTTVTLVCNPSSTSCATPGASTTVTASACATVSLLLGSFHIAQRTTMRVEQGQTSPSATTGWTPDATQCS